MRLTGPRDVPQRAETTKHDFGYTFDQPDATAVYQNVVSNDGSSPYVLRYVLQLR